MTCFHLAHSAVRILDVQTNIYVILFRRQMCRRKLCGSGLRDYLTSRNTEHWGASVVYTKPTFFLFHLIFFFFTFSGSSANTISNKFTSKINSAALCKSFPVCLSQKYNFRLLLNRRLELQNSIIDGRRIQHFWARASSCINIEQSRFSLTTVRIASKQSLW